MGVGVFAVLLLAVLALLRALRNYSCLCAIPGPPLAAWSDLWRIFARNVPRYGQRLSILHQNYGMVVRLGPNHLSIADGTRFAQINRDHPTQSVTVPQYEDHLAIPDGPMNSPENSQMTHAVWEYAHGLAQYEGLIDLSAKQLIRAIRKYQVLDLTASLRIFVSSFLTDLTTDGLLNKEPVNDQMAANNRYLRAFSVVEYMLIRSPVTALKRDRGRRMTTCSGLPLPASTVAGRGTGALPARPKTRDSSSVEGSRGAARGADGVASAFLSLFYFLLKGQRIFARLKNEIDTAFCVGSLSDLPLWRELNRLHYLDAALKESMRLSSAAAFEEEIVTLTGVTLSGFPIHRGTTIACNARVLHFDDDVFGNDVHLFQPERWLTRDAQQRSRMEHGLLLFNRCVRGCPEVEVAWLELKKVVVLIILKFNLQLFHVAEPSNDKDDGMDSPPSMIVGFTPRLPGF
ncbi:putative cytochrome P450 monooxygenase [Aspergillus ibericus CBS 121593]|uniref:Cytochrome P450 n=1 Tax=Aspergillus ibericus CBS 121593 TaxID=1448316 RepID=A0A395GTE5_9EURO|nr:cytochrome P450 [Aspergillus ibericus CBS 121593]RAK98454.1 cytochrome P450 [Aspergillus ibericus CBS 121593]